MSHRLPQKRSPAQWQALIDAQAASGLSQAAFCVSENLSQTTFPHWKRRLKRPASAADSAVISAALFTPLAGAAHTPKAASDWDVALDLGAGIRLRVRRSGS